MSSDKLVDSGMIAVTAKIMVVVIIILFLAVVFIFSFYLFIKWFRNHQQEDNATTRRRRRRFDFAGGYQEVNVLREGLDPSILETIPVVPFNTKDFKDGVSECSVCISEVTEGEKIRILPKCNHGFHIECIDMWFQSHFTCPLCRSPISELGSSPVVEVGRSAETETQNIPINVLFWGDENQVRDLGSCLENPTSVASTSTRTDGVLVIDIPS